MKKNDNVITLHTQHAHAQYVIDSAYIILEDGSGIMHAACGLTCDGKRYINYDGFDTQLKLYDMLMYSTKSMSWYTS